MRVATSMVVDGLMWLKGGEETFVPSPPELLLEEIQPVAGGSKSKRLPRCARCLELAQPE